MLHNEHITGVAATKHGQRCKDRAYHVDANQRSVLLIVDYVISWNNVHDIPRLNVLNNLRVSLHKSLLVNNMTAIILLINSLLSYMCAILVYQRKYYM